MHHGVRNTSEQAFFERITKRLDTSPFGLALLDGELRSTGKRHGIGDVLGARAATTVLRPAMKERIDPRPASDVHRANSLWRADLVAGDREQVDSELAHVDVDLPERLHGVGVHDPAASLDAFRDLGDRLDRADLVVHPHHCADCNRVVDRGVAGSEIDDATLRDREHPLGHPSVRRMMDRLEHRLVLDGRRHENATAFLDLRAERTKHCEVVGFGTA